MAISYHNETVISGKYYTLNHYRFKRLREVFLLTTDQGSWVTLNKDEFDKLQRGELDDSLFKLLEEKGVILTKNNIKKIMYDYWHRYNFLFSGTALHIIVPTLRCNQRCIYCHASSKDQKLEGYDMDEEIMKKTVDFIFQTPAKVITIEFQGGDSMLNKSIVKGVIEYSLEKNKEFKKDVRFALVTNLTLMDKAMLGYLKEKKVNICTSLDGPEKIHDYNRPYDNGKGTYNDVMSWIDTIKEECPSQFGALMVLTKKSLPFYKEIIDEYVNIGVREIQIKQINKLGYANKTWRELGYTEEEFLDFWKNSMEYIIQLSKKGVDVRERFANIIIQKILTIYDPNFLDLRSPCGLVTGQLSYNYNGDIYCCDEGRGFEMFKMGNVKTDTYKEVLSSKKTREMIAVSMNDNFLCDACVYKPYCGICPVMNYAEDKTLLPKLNRSRCKITKFMFDYIFDKLLFDEECREIFFDWATNWNRKSV